VHWWEGAEMLPAIGGKEINVKLLQASGQLESLRATASGVEFLAGRSGRCLMYRAGAPTVTALRYGPRGGGGGALHRRRLRLVRLLAINGLCTGAARLKRD